MVGYYLQFRNKLGTFGIRLEGARSGGDVVMLDIHDVHTAFLSLFNGCIQIVNDILIMLCDVILDIDDNKSLIHRSASFFMLPCV